MAQNTARPARPYVTGTPAASKTAMTLAFILDPLYFIVVGPFMIIAMIATARVKSTFQRFSQVGVRTGMTGAQAAAAVARAGGADVTIERHPGFLSDHYDPRSHTLRLSPEVYDGRSVSSIAVAAHEAGHALQHVAKYPALAFRSAVVPMAQIGSNAWMYIFIAGLIFQMPMLIDIGIVLFAGVVLFQLITLPVEFDASNRAKAVLADTGIVTTQEEAQGVSKVLRAAAMTYVASALTAIATLVYLLMRRD
jgi:Zn-dependent membrane protease YugP